MNTEVTTTEQVKPSAIVTIDPPSYVAEVFAPFQQRLDVAVASAKAARIIAATGEVAYVDAEGERHPITSKVGMELAKAQRRTLKAIRIDSDKERAARKAPILTIGKLLDSRYKEIEAAVTPHEELFDADIVAEEKRIEDEKAAAIKAEAERQAALQAKIDNIKSAPLRAISMTSEQAQAVMDDLNAVTADSATFAERFVEAEIALEAAKGQLAAMIDGKKAQEELAKHRAEQEAREAEARKAEELRQAEAKAAEEKRLADERAAFQRQQDEFKRQQEEFAAQQKVLADRQAALDKQEADRKAAVEAEQLAEQERAEALQSNPVAEVTHVEAHAAPAPAVASNVVEITRHTPQPSRAALIAAVQEVFGATYEQAHGWLTQAFGQEAA